MFPVLMVLCHLEGTPQYRECEVQDLFTEDMSILGGGVFLRSIIMTAGPLGTGSFYQYAFDPKSALALGLLVEYTEECHHGFAAIVMRRSDRSHMLPTPLTMSGHGNWLDSLPPPQVRRLSQSDEDFELQAEIVSDWIATSEYIEQLELENRMLRAQLNR